MNARNPSEEEIFAEALRRPTPDERAAYLQNACGGDEQLRHRIEALLPTHENAGEFLDQPSAAVSAKTIVVTADMIPLTEKPGDRIGRYKLLQEIGTGGMGSVWMAEQEEPVRRRVALKVIKLGMDTKQVIGRFEAERQALALMDHPNIAKVLDAGATDTGRPFFVMELVRGVPITEYCDKHTLSSRARLELFVSVCQAVQHAHQKGIIHRDLKPSNILVTLNDGVPVPKVIDFGIAKATTGQRLTDKTLFTAFEQFIGTPAYMSPEQAEMSALDIDTRSDIYSLGVLLYELLTNTTPFEARRLLEAGLDEMRRIIREEDPPRPSTRISTLDAAEQTTVAKHRQSEPPKLLSLIRGDLDWIVMKCLEKDRTRRYDTANGLAMDLQRHLSNEPVVARPQSNFYRFQKLVRRNKLAFAAAGAVAAALITGLGVSTWMFIKERNAEIIQSQLRQQAETARQNESRLRQQAEANEKKAKTEAAKSEQVAQFLKDMLKGVGPSVALGDDTTMLRKILYNTVAHLGKDLKDQPEVEIELRFTVAETYRQLGLYKEMEEMARETLRLAKSRFGEEHRTVAHSLGLLGWALYMRSDFAGAEMFYRQALAIVKKLDDTHPDVAMGLHILATLLGSEGRLTEAETMFREVLARRKKLYGEVHADVAISLDNLAGVFEKQGRLDEAESMCREALAMERKLFGEIHPDMADTLGQLVSLLRKRGKFAEAETLGREQRAMQEKLSGNEQLRVANSGNTSVEPSRSAADLTPAVESQPSSVGSRLSPARLVAKEAAANLSKAVELYPDQHSNWYQLAPLLLESGDPAGYRKNCQAMLVRFGTTSDPSIAERTAKACLLLPLDGADLATASRLADIAVTVGENHEYAAYFHFAKSLAEYRQSHFAGAVEWALKALAALGIYSRDAQAYLVIAMAHHQLKHPDKARIALAKGIEIAEQRLPKLDSGDVDHDVLIVRILMREAKALIQGQPDAASDQPKQK